MINESIVDDDVGPDDVFFLLEHAESIVPVDGDKKWKVYGHILNGDACAVVVRIREDSVIVVTCHEPP